MLYPLMIFYILILDIMMEGTVSQIFNLSLSFHLIESRKLSLKKHKKLPVFSNQIKTKR